MSDPESNLLIRPYAPGTDLEGLKACVIAIQDFERGLIPSLPSGAVICEAYIEDMLIKCQRYRGDIYMAVIDEAIVGYVSLFLMMRSHEIDDGDAHHAQIGDLVLLSDYRGLGFGKRLMHDAERRAREAGAETLRIGVLSANTSAAQLYLSQGFKPLAMDLQKTL